MSIKLVVEIVQNVILDKLKDYSIRVHEHEFYDKVGASSISDHKIMTGHNIDYDHAKVLRYVSSLPKRLICEALLMRDHDIFDHNTGRELKLFG